MLVKTLLYTHLLGCLILIPISVCPMLNSSSAPQESNPLVALYISDNGNFLIPGFPMWNNQSHPQLSCPLIRNLLCFPCILHCDHPRLPAFFSPSYGFTLPYTFYLQSNLGATDGSLKYQMRLLLVPKPEIVLHFSESKSTTCPQDEVPHLPSFSTVLEYYSPEKCLHAASWTCLLASDLEYIKT